MKFSCKLLIYALLTTSYAFGMLQYNLRANKQPQANTVLGVVPYVQTKEDEVYLYLGEYEIDGKKIYGSFLEIAGDNKQDLLNLTKSYGTTLERIFLNSLSEVTVQASSQAAGKETDINVIFQKVPADQKGSLNFFARSTVPENFPHKIREFSFKDLVQSQRVPRWGFEAVRKINGEDIIFETTFYDAFEKFKPALESAPQPIPQPTSEPSGAPSDSLSNLYNIPGQELYCLVPYKIIRQDYRPTSPAWGVNVSLREYQTASGEKVLAPYKVYASEDELNQEVNRVSHNEGNQHIEKVDYEGRTYNFYFEEYAHRSSIPELYQIPVHKMDEITFEISKSNVFGGQARSEDKDIMDFSTNLDTYVVSTPVGIAIEQFANNVIWKTGSAPEPAPVQTVASSLNSLAGSLGDLVPVISLLPN